MWETKQTNYILSCQKQLFGPKTNPISNRAAQGPELQSSGSYGGVCWLEFSYWSWLISRPFSPFQASLAGIWQHYLLLKMRFSMIKLQFILQKWIQYHRLPLGHPDYAIPITENYPLKNFHQILPKKLFLILGANGLEFRLVLSYWFRYLSRPCCFYNRRVLRRERKIQEYDVQRFCVGDVCALNGSNAWLVLQNLYGC